jgi:MFS family permease
MTAYDITDTSIRQAVVHDRQLGRVNATVRVAVLVAQLAATLLAGFLALQIGLRAMLFIGPTVGLLGVLFVWFSPVRKLRRIEDLAPAD